MDDANGFLVPEIGADEAKKRAEAEDRRLANLKPFEKGVSGNPAGRKAGGMHVKEAVNLLLHRHEDGRPAHTWTEIEALQNSDDPALRLGARRIVLAGADPRRYTVDEEGVSRCVGSDPEVGKAFAQIMDYTSGKPAQRVEVEAEISRPIHEIQAELLATIGTSPELMQLLLQSGTIRPTIPSDEEVTEALGDGER